jgi:hypothetical protein
MFITFNTTKQAMQFIKNRYKTMSVAQEKLVLGDKSIYRIDIDDKKRIIEISGWSCGCGCGKASVTATVLGKLKKQVRS